MIAEAYDAKRVMKITNASIVLRLKQDMHMNTESLPQRKLRELNLLIDKFGCSASLIYCNMHTLRLWIGKKLKDMNIEDWFMLRCEDRLAKVLSFPIFFIYAYLLR